MAIGIPTTPRLPRPTSGERPGAAAGPSHESPTAVAPRPPVSVETLPSTPAAGQAVIVQLNFSRAGAMEPDRAGRLNGTSPAAGADAPAVNGLSAEQLDFSFLRATRDYAAMLLTASGPTPACIATRPPDERF